jgi:hypothetical protein
MDENVFYIHFCIAGASVGSGKVRLFRFRLFVDFFSKVNFLTFETLLLTLEELEGSHG